MAARSSGCGCTHLYSDTAPQSCAQPYGFPGILMCWADADPWLPTPTVQEKGFQTIKCKETVHTKAAPVAAEKSLWEGAGPPRCRAEWQHVPGVSFAALAQ